MCECLPQELIYDLHNLGILECAASEKPDYLRLWTAFAIHYGDLTTCVVAPERAVETLRAVYRELMRSRDLLGE